VTLQDRSRTETRIIVIYGIFLCKDSVKGAKIQILQHPIIFFIFAFTLTLQNDILFKVKADSFPATKEIQGPALSLSG
jgi:hypothetical protein